MRIDRVFLGVALMAVSAPAFADEPAQSQLKALTARYVDYDKSRSADDEDGTRARLPDVTPKALAERAAFAAELLASLDAIDKGALSQPERVDAIVLRTMLIEEIGDASFREWEMPFDSDNNFWSYLAARRGFRTVKEYEQYIARMRDIPRYFGEQTDNARAGLARGFSVPRVTLEGRSDLAAALLGYLAGGILPG